jgi:hypothetical protein
LHYAWQRCAYRHPNHSHLNIKHYCQHINNNDGGTNRIANQHPHTSGNYTKASGFSHTPQANRGADCGA